MDYFGPDSDRAMRDKADEWRAAFLADGWTERQTYPGSESQPDCYSYDKGDWKAAIYNYQTTPDRYKVSVAIWGPDHLAIDVPGEYDWHELQRLLKVCGYCHKEVEKTVSLGFAGRACPGCREKLVHKIEYPGWTS